MTLFGDVVIHHEMSGEGPPIVLVHGFASSFERGWRRTGWVDFLAGEGLEVTLEPTPVFTNRLQCVECDRVSRENERDWKAYFGDADG